LEAPENSLRGLWGWKKDVGKKVKHKQTPKFSRRWIEVSCRRWRGVTQEKENEGREHDASYQKGGGRTAGGDAGLNCPFDDSRLEK